MKHFLPISLLVMVLFLLLFFSTLTFAFSARSLAVAMSENVVLMSFVEPYSRRALKIAKAYKVGAWGLLTLVLFIATLQSFLSFFEHF